MFAVVSSPASSIVSALPSTSRSVKRAGLGVLRREDRLEQIRRPRAPLGLLLEPRAGARDQRGGELVHFRDRRVELPVGGQLDVVPVAQRRQQPAQKRGEDLPQVLLDRVGRLLQRVEVVAEHEAAGDVDREPHQVALRVDRAALAGRALPAPLQPRRHLLEPAEEIAQVARVQGVHRQLPLAPPVRALGDEQAVDAELAHGVPHRGAASEAFRSIAQHPVDQLDVADDDDPPAEDAVREDRAELVRPALQDRCASCWGGSATGCRGPGGPGVREADRWFARRSACPARGDSRRSDAPRGTDRVCLPDVPAG